MELRCALHAVTRTEFPLSFGPWIRFLDRHHFGQVLPAHAGRGLRCSYGLGDRCGTNRLAGGQGHDAAVLRTVSAQVAGQLAGVEVGNCHRALADQVRRQ